MLLDLTVSKSIEINASPEKVWEGLTNPDIIKQYLFGTETITDWKPGSDIIFQGEYKGTKYKDKGVVLENVLHKLIRYKYWSGFSGVEDKPENYNDVIYTLQTADAKTSTFTWTQKGFATEEGYKHSLAGMDDFLKLLKEEIEKTNTI